MPVICAAFLLFIFSALIPSHASAATLLVSPAASTVSIGNIISTKILVATDGKAINNVDSIVQFPADLLEVVSISKTGSIFPMWVEEPGFSNIEGKITLNGGVPNPGFTGQSGEVVSVTFRAKKAGTATIAFSDSAVRENNGLGTDILTTKQLGTVQITSAQPLEIPVAVVGRVPGKPVVNSSSHSDPELWYAHDSASFSWVVPAGVTSVQTLLGKNADSVPTITYDNSVSQRTVNNLSDGILYFHIRYQNAAGWGQITHQKIKIDTTAPEKFSVDVRNDGAKNIVTLNASDATSGVDSYSIQIDDQDPISIRNEEIESEEIETDGLTNGEFVLPVQNGGDHTLIVTAFDKAGNSTESRTTFVSPEIFAPTIQVSATEVIKNETITVTGRTNYSNAVVMVYVQLENGEIGTYTTRTADDGSYVVTTKELERTGSTTFSAQLIFSDTISSPVSKKIFVVVNDSPFVKTSKMIIFGLCLLIAMLILVIVLIIVSYLGWHRFFGLKRAMARDLEIKAESIHRALMAFKEELSRQLLELEKARLERSLNRKEEKIFKELKANVDSIDDFVEKKLKKLID